MLLSGSRDGAEGMAVAAPLGGEGWGGVCPGLLVGPWSHRKSSFLEILRLRGGTSKPVLLLEVVSV